MSKKLHKAIKYATKKHNNQNRGGTPPLPYITHPLEVLHALYDIGKINNGDMLCAAILHDVIELSNATEEKILKKFGAEVHQLVLELTRTEPSKNEYFNLSKEELKNKRALLLMNDIKTRMSPDAQVIKLADRLVNLKESLRTRSGKNLNQYIEQTEMILKAIPQERSPALWNEIETLLKSA